MASVKNLEERVEYKMIIRSTLFSFDLGKNGKVDLRSVRFLGDEAMNQKDNLLLVKDKGAIQFYYDRTTPLSRLSKEQFTFISCAARYFGYLPEQESMPVWLWGGSLDLPDACHPNVAVSKSGQQPVAYC